MLSEETDNPGDSVPPLIDRGPYQVISVRSKYRLPGEGPGSCSNERVQTVIFRPEAITGGTRLISA